MRLRGEWIVDILDPCQQECDQASASENGQEDKTDDVTATGTREIGVQADFSSDDDLRNNTKTEDTRPSATRADDEGDGLNKDPASKTRIDSLSSSTASEKDDSRTNLPDIIDSSLTQRNQSDKNEERRLPSDSTELDTLHLEDLHITVSSDPLTDMKSIDSTDDGGSKEPLDFQTMFDLSYKYLDMVLKEKLPLRRLYWLVKCIQSLSNTVSRQIGIATGKCLPYLITFFLLLFFPHRKRIGAVGSSLEGYTERLIDKMSIDLSEISQDMYVPKVKFCNMVGEGRFRGGATEGGGGGGGGEHHDFPDLFYFCFCLSAQKSVM